MQTIGGIIIRLMMVTRQEGMGFIAQEEISLARSTNSSFMDRWENRGYRHRCRQVGKCGEKSMVRFFSIALLSSVSQEARSSDKSKNGLCLQFSYNTLYNQNNYFMSMVNWYSSIYLLVFVQATFIYYQGKLQRPDSTFQEISFSH